VNESWKENRSAGLVFTCVWQKASACHRRDHTERQCRHANAICLLSRVCQLANHFGVWNWLCARARGCDWPPTPTFRGGDGEGKLTCWGLCLRQGSLRARSTKLIDDVPAAFPRRMSVRLRSGASLDCLLWSAARLPASLLFDAKAWHRLPWLITLPHS
jgi:hypothetical protein